MYDKKTVLITGTSSGIGKETAYFFSRKNWNVAATMRDVNNCSDFDNDINIRKYYLDVCDINSIDICIKDVIKDFGKIDVIINNAGIYNLNPVEIISNNDIENIINTNIKGVIYTTKIILRHFRENKSGVIINISSIVGKVPFPFQTVYNCSKWAIEGFSEGLYYELQSLNIKVKLIEVGLINTNLIKTIADVSFEQYPSSYKEKMYNSYKFIMEEYEKEGHLPIVVAKTIYRAINDKSPKLRYVTDFRSKFLIALNNLFPLSLFQKFIAKVKYNL